MASVTPIFVGLTFNNLADLHTLLVNAESTTVLKFQSFDMLFILDVA